MEILTDIPFELNQSEFSARLRVEPDTEDAAEFAGLLEKVRALGNPKALYRESFVGGRGDDTVTIDGVTFTSRALRANLDGVERVFPYIATCGAELDLMDLPSGDFLWRFRLDAIKTTLLQFSINHLKAHLTRRYALGKTSAMSPGSGDLTVWRIQQQAQLFSLLGDVEDLIGVQLTRSFLMVPNKSVSGIRFPTEIDFRTCQLCHRAKCPSRAAPFDHELWKSIHPDMERKA